MTWGGISGGEKRRARDIACRMAEWGLLCSVMRFGHGGCGFITSIVYPNGFRGASVGFVPEYDCVYRHIRTGS
jgi:hypothetical protein